MLPSTSQAKARPTRSHMLLLATAFVFVTSLPTLRTAQVVAQVQTEAIDLETVQGHVLSLEFSPNGKYLVAGGMDRTIRLWDVSKGSLLATLPRQKTIIRGVAFAPDGQVVASIADGGTISLWDIFAGRLMKSFQETDVGLLRIAFSPNGNLLASAVTDARESADKWTGHVKLWNITNGQLERTLKVDDGQVSAVAFTPDGEMIAGGGRVVHLWNVKTGKLQKLLKPNQKSLFYAIAFTPDGKVLVAAGNYGVKDPVTGRNRPRGQISIWNTNTGRLLRTITGHTNGIRCVAITDDGKMIASGSSGGWIRTDSPGRKLVTELRMWDLQTGRLLSTFEGGQDDGFDILSLDFVPNAKTLAVADDKAVFLFDPEAPQQKRVLLKTVLRPFSGK